MKRDNSLEEFLENLKDKVNVKRGEKEERRKGGNEEDLSPCTFQPITVGIVLNNWLP